jgi:MAC/Perforin domain
MSEKEKIKNWDFIGRCFDVLKIDPLKIEDGALTARAFEFPESDFQSTPDDRFLYPTATKYVAGTGGKSSSRTITILSSYDFQTFNKVENSISVSDPTGEMFKTSLSNSYTHTSNQTGSQNSVVTYTSQTVEICRLELSESEEGNLEVSKELAKGVLKLPSARNPTAYEAFIKKFGTHYSSSITLGGRAYQRVTVKEAEYSSFLEDGLDMTGEAKLTFDIASAGGRAGQQDTRSKKFVNATKSSTDDIKHSGGTPFTALDSWTPTVKDDPAPIKVNLEPLYELLIEKFFVSDPEIEKKQALLRTAIDEYLSSKGEDVKNLEMHYQEKVFLGLRGADDSVRYLSAADPRRYARTCKIPLATEQDASLVEWIIVNAKDPDSEDKVQVNDVIALRCVSGAYLDAQAGADSRYERGDGLTAASGVDLSASSTRWKVVLADQRRRNQIVDGDYIRLQSQWRNSEGDLGYLMGERAEDKDQRVYSFGDKKGKGTIWLLSRKTE